MPNGDPSFFRLFDRSFYVRLLLPWTVPLILWQTRGSAAITSELLAGMAVILSARLFADESFRGIVQGIFCVAPFAEGVLVLGAGTRFQYPLVAGRGCYLVAAIGTVFAVISEARQRR